MSVADSVGLRIMQNDSSNTAFFMFLNVFMLGQLSFEDTPTMVLCKPKLLPLKSVTLEKMEKMQREAEATIRQQELAQRQQQ